MDCLVHLDGLFSTANTTVLLNLQICNVKSQTQRNPVNRGLVTSRFQLHRGWVPLTPVLFKVDTTATKQQQKGYLKIGKLPLFLPKTFTKPFRRSNAYTIPVTLNFGPSLASKRVPPFFWSPKPNNYTHPHRSQTLQFQNSHLGITDS